MATRRVGPIKPSEVVAAKRSNIPDGVFEIFNALIIVNMHGTSATVKQCEVVDQIVQKMQCTRQEIFDKGWLEIEDVYRKAGWHVEYDKPGFNEMYDAFFTFRSRPGKTP